ncbi:hypothetical protein WA026_002507 [Henosepilachna vigintioctopunctata]|uniref:Uncharacterized protein n=1 Tax=Henosepilachna vigintioctopunctata TaxID=420089 RepID=A0AAW1TRJ7_9CUCU
MYREDDTCEYHKELTSHNIKNGSEDKTKAKIEFHIGIACPATSMKRNVLEMWGDMKGLFPVLEIILAISETNYRLFLEAEENDHPVEKRFSGHLSVRPGTGVSEDNSRLNFVLNVIANFS